MEITELRTSNAVRRIEHRAGESAFGFMATAFELAVTKSKGHIYESFYTFAGQLVHVRTVGRELARRIGPAFDHLRSRDVDEPKACLRIDLWAENETEVPCPGGPTGRDEGQERDGWINEYRMYIDSPADRFVGCQRFNVLTWSDRVGLQIVGCIADSTRLVAYERGKPLYFPLLVWHSDRDADVIHAAMVARNNHGVLFAGKGATGKTTAALACLTEGFCYLGDDYVGLQITEDGSSWGHSIYNTAWLQAGQSTRFPWLAQHVIRGDGLEEKEFVYLSRVYPGRMGSASPVRLLVLPRIVKGAVARAYPASKGEALLAMAPSSLIRLPISRVQSLRKMASMVDQVPCYWLELGEDLGSIPRLVENLLIKEYRI